MTSRLTPATSAPFPSSRVCIGQPSAVIRVSMSRSASTASRRPLRVQRAGVQRAVLLVGSVRTLHPVVHRHVRVQVRVTSWEVCWGKMAAVTPAASRHSPVSSEWYPVLVYAAHASISRISTPAVSVSAFSMAAASASRLAARSSSPRSLACFADTSRLACSTDTDLAAPSAKSK